MFVVGTNAWSAGYVCTEFMTYTSCSNGYYVSDCGASSNWSGQTLTESDVSLENTCEPCPTGYACTGGLACPTKSSTQSGYLCDDVKRYVSCPAGEYLSDCGDTSNWVGQTLDKSELAIGNACVSCPDGYTCVGGAACPIIPDYKFELKTVAGTSSFEIIIQAVGNFVIDWGDGKVETVIINENLTYKSVPHAYATAGTYTIKMGGLATEYNVEAITEDDVPVVSFSSSKIASIDGSIGAIFPTLQNGDQPGFFNTFASSKITSLPPTLFKGIHGAGVSMFVETFVGCTGLTEIPAELFSDITGAADGMFSGTFYGCTNLTSIPAGLFSGVSGAADYMFSATFDGCTGLTEIPAELFSGVSGAAVYMFDNTFYGCTGLTEIPADLFSGISGAANGMFYGTFDGCTNLTSIPDGLFDGVAGAETLPDGMFSRTFYNNTSLTGSAAKMSAAKGGKYLHEIWPMTGATMNTYTGTNIDNLAYIPSSWGGGGYVDCPAGWFLRANDTTCTECPADAQYCPGGLMEFSETKASGLFDCPGGYTYNKEAGKSDARECQISCGAGYGYRIAAPGASACAYDTQGGWFTMNGVHVTNYGDVSSVYWCANGFDNNSSIYPAGHINADFACVDGTVAVANRGTNYAPDVMAIRVTNLGSDNTDALVVTEIGAFAWEADTYVNNNSMKIFNYGDSILYNTNGLSTDGRGTGPEIGIENLDDASALGVVLDAGDEYTWDFSDPAQIGTIKISVMPIVADGYADNYANANFKIDVLVADTWYTVFDTSSRAYNDYGSTVGAHMPKTFNILPMMSTACPAGSYGNTSAVSGVKYSTINSSNVCTACAAGKYQDVQGQTSCKNCDALLGIKAESAEGSASKEACYIPADNLADDGTGQYRYTNDCYYK